MFGRGRGNKGKSGSASGKRCRNLFYLNGGMISRRRAGDCHEEYDESSLIESMNTPELNELEAYVPEVNAVVNDGVVSYHDEPVPIKSMDGDNVPVGDAIVIICDYFEKYEGSRDMLYRFSRDKVGTKALTSLREWASMRNSTSSDSEGPAELIPPPSPIRQEYSEGGRDDDDIPDEFGAIEVEEEQVDTSESLLFNPVEEIEALAEVSPEDTPSESCEEPTEPENWTIAMKSNHKMVRGTTKVEGYILSIDLEIEDLTAMPIEIYPFGSEEDKTYMYPFDEDILFSFKYANMVGNATCSLDEKDRFLSIDMLVADDEELIPPLDGKMTFTLNYPPEEV